jgi:hypothetical protein
MSQLVSLCLSVCLSVCLSPSLQLAPTIVAAECSPKLYNTNEVYCVTSYRGSYDLFRNITFQKNLCFVLSNIQRNKVGTGLFFRYLFLPARFNFTKTKWSKSGKLKKAQQTETSRKCIGQRNNPEEQSKLMSILNLIYREEREEEEETKRFLIV